MPRLLLHLTGTSCLAFCLLLASCGGDDASSGEDADTASMSETDSRATGDDASDGNEGDLPESDTGDGAPTETGDGDVSDLPSDSDVGGAPTDGDGDGDTDDSSGESTHPEPDVVACDETDIEPCAEGRVCMDGVCRIPLQGRVYGEVQFEIDEPDSLGRLLVAFKSLASNVTFLVIDGRAGLDDEGVLTSRYGAADIIDRNASPTLVRWQVNDEVDEMDLIPAPDDMARYTRRWISPEPFQYRLAGIATIGNQQAGFEMPSEDVTFDITLDQDGQGADIVVEGLITREEAESRFLGTRQQISLLELIVSDLCTVSNYELGEDEIWYLADILDCNEVPMDRDFSGDGEMDSYFVRITGRLARMQLTF